VAERKPDRSDREVIRALSHPLRVRILEAVQGHPASTSELAEQMGRSVGVIAYHANTLLACGCLEIVETLPREGSVEHRFGIAPACFVDAAEWSRADDEIRCDVTEATMRALMDRASKVIGLAASEERRRRARDRGTPGS
jgi:DNA-binding transcriptional ArsR family regulator